MENALEYDSVKRMGTLCVHDSPRLYTKQSRIWVFWFCALVKQVPGVHSSIQHKCYYLNTSSHVSGLVLVLMAPTPAVCLIQNFPDHRFSPSLQLSSSSNRKCFTNKDFSPGRRGQRKSRRGVCLPENKWWRELNVLSCWTYFLLFLRVLQSTDGAVIPARPSINRTVLPSLKAAPEAHKGSSPPKPDLSTPPVPTLGRGYTEGEDILLDMSPPPCTKSMSAAKVYVSFITENKSRQAAWKKQNILLFFIVFTLHFYLDSLVYNV